MVRAIFFSVRIRSRILFVICPAQNFSLKSETFYASVGPPVGSSTAVFEVEQRSTCIIALATRLLAECTATNGSLLLNMCSKLNQHIQEQAAQDMLNLKGEDVVSESNMVVHVKPPRWLSTIATATIILCFLLSIFQVLRQRRLFEGTQHRFSPALWRLLEEVPVEGSARFVSEVGIWHLHCLNVFIELWWTTLHNHLHQRRKDILRRDARSSDVVVKTPLPSLPSHCHFMCSPRYIKHR